MTPNAQLPGPVTFDRDTGMIETTHPVDLTGAFGHVCDLRPAAFGPERGTYDEPTARLLASAYSAFDRAGRTLHVDAAQLADATDLAALLRWARAVIACHAAMDPGDRETPLDRAIYGLGNALHGIPIVTEDTPA